MAWLIVKIQGSLGYGGHLGIKRGKEETKRAPSTICLESEGDPQMRGNFNSSKKNHGDYHKWERLRRLGANTGRSVRVHVSEGIEVRDQLRNKKSVIKKGVRQTFLL